jgi:hypothetical protein
VKGKVAKEAQAGEALRQFKPVRDKIFFSQAHSRAFARVLLGAAIPAEKGLIVVLTCFGQSRIYEGFAARLYPPVVVIQTSDVKIIGGAGRAAFSEFIPSVGPAVGLHYEAAFGQ